MIFMQKRVVLRLLLFVVVHLEYAVVLVLFLGRPSVGQVVLSSWQHVRVCFLDGYQQVANGAVDVFTPSRERGKN